MVMERPGVEHEELFTALREARKEVNRIRARVAQCAMAVETSAHTLRFRAAAVASHELTAGDIPALTRALNEAIAEHATAFEILRRIEAKQARLWHDTVSGD